MRAPIVSVCWVPVKQNVKSDISSWWMAVYGLRSVSPNVESQWNVVSRLQCRQMTGQSWNDDVENSLSKDC